MGTQDKGGSDTPYFERDVEEGIQLVECETWLGFMTYIENERRDTKGYVWRGQQCSNWLLESSLARDIRKRPDIPKKKDGSIPSRTLADYGGMGMQAFELSIRQFDISDADDVKKWAIGRHHGLKTPYIDWSRSPYVAAFFAFADHVERPSYDSDYVAVYGLSDWIFPFQAGSRTQDNGRIEDHVLHKIDAGQFGNQRGIAQQGVLTALMPPDDIESFVKKLSSTEEAIGALFKITMPKTIAWHALKHLNHMNVNYKTLFPDIEGAARHANLAILEPGYEGVGSWSVPPGFAHLLPKKKD